MTDSKLQILLSGIAVALVLTILIEGIVTLIFTRKWRYVLFNYWCNVLTNPALNLILYCVRSITGSDAYSAVVILEIAVLFTECALYQRFDRHRRSTRWYFLLSLLTNAVSFGTGELLDRVFFSRTEACVFPQTLIISIPRRCSDTCGGSLLFCTFFF